MSIISALLILLGVITLLIGVFAYKKRTLIMEALYVRANAKRALRELEQNMYMSAYEEALKEELPRAMQEKAQRDFQRKYNKTSLSEKLDNGFISIIDDINIFNRDKVKGNK